MQASGQVGSLTFTDAWKNPPIVTFFAAGSVELLRITPDGEVVAPSLEAASEAGRVFVEAIQHNLEALIARRVQAALADDTWRALA